MRIAVLIIGLVLGFIIMVQSFSVGVLSEIGNNEKNSNAGAGGLWVAIFWIIGSALAIAFPMASVVLFALASVIAFAIAGSSDFQDMWVWGCFGVALAIFSFFGWRGKRKDRREQATEKQRQLDRDNRMEQLLTSQSSRPTPTAPERGGSPTTCPTCGHTNAPWTKFCAECGQSLQTNSATT
jgi:hypothetical protein